MSEQEPRILTWEDDGDHTMIATLSPRDWKKLASVLEAGYDAVSRFGRYEPIRVDHLRDILKAMYDQANKVADE